MRRLTVFTPTYNRAFCLEQCYESLVRQTCSDFIWLIIDDGSTDNTEALVRSWINQDKIKIRYKWQENKGMHGAHNTAYELIDTELNVCIDSDDYMTDDAIEKIMTFWNQHGSDQVAGIIGLNSNFDHQIIGTTLPDDLKTSTLYDLYYKYKVTGDKKLIYRTELTRKYPYPLFKDEKYVGLAYKYYRLDTDYPLLLMNEIVCRVEYLPDGSSVNMVHQYIKNPKGFSFYRQELMKLPFVSFTFKFRQAIHYVSSSLMSRNKRFIKETSHRVLTILAIPLGFTLYAYIKMKARVS